MNYYPLHIGDYLRDTSHLSMLEDGAYRRMLDLYYASERPLPANVDGLYRLLRAKSKAERDAVDVVLQEFFERAADGWHNARADVEIAKAQEKSGKAKASAAHRWQSGGNANASANASKNAMRTHSEGNAPNNQEPRTKEKEQSAQRSRGSRLPAGWKPTEDLLAWAGKERPDLDLGETQERFRDHWAAAPGSKGVKLDWEATFRNWVRNEKPGRAALLQAVLPTTVQLGDCPCGALATMKVGGKPRCGAHARYDFSTAAKAA